MKYVLALLFLVGCSFEPKQTVIILDPTIIGKCFRTERIEYKYGLIRIVGIKDSGYNLSLVSSKCDIYDKYNCILAESRIGWTRGDMLKKINGLFGDPIDCKRLIDGSLEPTGSICHIDPKNILCRKDNE